MHCIVRATARTAMGMILAIVAMAAQGEEARPAYPFGVINQRSVNLTAQTWNPILAYVGRKSGVPLALRIGKTAPETTAMTERGEHAFAYTNHMFTPQRDKLGYKAILRLKGPPIRGVVVVRSDSPVRALADLQGRTMAFPSPEAFVGYSLPSDHLKKSGIVVKEVFAGNQEGAIAQLQAGQVAAAAVNQKLLEKYTEREMLSYRVIWTSEPFLDIPVMVHPSVPAAVAEAVRAAFIGIGDDPEGRKALLASAAALESREVWTFIRAEDREYDNYRRFYRSVGAKAE